MESKEVPTEFKIDAGGSEPCLRTGVLLHGDTKLSLDSAAVDHGCDGILAQFSAKETSWTPAQVQAWLFTGLARGDGPRPY